MSYLATFTNQQPPLRYDGNPWTQVVVGEAPVVPGQAPWQCEAFSPVATVSLASLPGGLDADPTQPVERSFTVPVDLESGLYVLTWQDAAGNMSAPSTPIFLPDVNDAIRPTLAEVGAIISTRTVAMGTGGNELGTFTTATRPTAAQVELLIDQAVRQLLLKVGPDVALRYRDDAKIVVLYLTAMLIEVSFFKDEIAKETSAYPLLEASYEDALKGLIDTMNDETPGTPTLGMFTVPVMNQSQANFQHLMRAYDPGTGMLDPSLLPPDMNWPNGPGGLPAELYASANAAWPLWFDWQDSASFLNSY